jgi:hypothetical protein
MEPKGWDLAMTDTTTHTSESEGSRQGGVDRMRRASFGALVTLLLQYGLGIGVNLFVTVPDADQHSGVGGAFGKAMSNGPAALAAHAGIGLLLIINAIVVLAQSLRSGVRAVAVASAVGLLSILGAAFAGAAFVSDGQNSASMTMAVLTGVALFCYGLNLYVLGPKRG